MIRRHLHSITVWLSVGLLSCGAGVSAPEVTDTMFMNDTAKSVRTGRVVSVDSGQIRLDVPLAAGGPGAKMSVSVPRVQIERIEFAANESREQLLSDPDLGDIHEIGVLWKAWESVLDLPKSPAARIGNIYAGLLLQANDPARAQMALELFTRIEQQSWDEGSKILAAQGRLRAMVATGNAAGAVAEAEQLAIDSENSEVLIEAKFILAEAAKSGLVKLQEDNPRWYEDINVRPERERLYHESLELYLYPYLFFGSETEIASRGLWGAINVYQLAQDVPAAIEASRDLVKLYPQTTFAKQAGEYLASLPEDKLQQDNEKEAQYENPDATETKN